MTDHRVQWRVVSRNVSPREDTVSAIGLVVTHQGQEYDISIALPQPIAGQTPENDVALAELARLRDALNSILDGQ